MATSNECCSVQLIDGDGSFNDTGIESFIKEVKLHECGLSYTVVSIRGPQSSVATPKQIRELMQVDSLTNDEVKSHLQKYRLHARRLPTTTTTTTPANQSGLVLGGGHAWMCQDQFGESSKGSSSQSGSPQGPLQLATNTGGTSTTGCESMEDDEDAKSECYSWKSHDQKPRKNNV